MTIINDNYHTLVGQQHPSLYPNEVQSVCQGQSVAYNCVGNGVKIELFSPPFINESRPLILYRNSSAPTCEVTRGSAAALVLVNPDSLDVSTFMGTLILYISTEYTELQESYSVFCRVSTSEGYVTLCSTYFTVTKSKFADCECMHIICAACNVSNCLQSSTSLDGMNHLLLSVMR